MKNKNNIVGLNSHDNEVNNITNKVLRQVDDYRYITDYTFDEIEEILQKHESNMKRKEHIQTIINHYGKDSQDDRAIEECAELIIAILKFRRYINNNPNERQELIAEIIDEAADVSVMIEQIKNLYGIHEEVEERIDYKLHRQIERIKQEE